MRGKGIHYNTETGEIRITPAHAGKSGGAATPRGSPPRMRGKVIKQVLAMLDKRITPAHAGKRAFAVQQFMEAEDHPRACGEKYPLWVNKFHDRGSPPRMRGKDSLVLLRIPYNRITPAHAGKRIVRKAIMSFTRDHPRACGEKLNFFISHDFGPGSPPRMRGKAAPTASIPLCGGITPAHAGKRSRAPRGCCCSEDHPRACGEKRTSRPETARRRGSPPRMRGKAH